MAINAFETMLSGGHPNSLGNTIEVVEIVLNDKNTLEDLYQCYFSDDEIVRLRVSNAMKRVCKERPEWIAPYIDRLLKEISTIDQPSTKWTLAQLFMLLDNKLTDTQRAKAIEILKYNLETENDWIVQNFTMEALTKWAHNDSELREWLVPVLQNRTSDHRTSVKKRAFKFLGELSDE
jgi:HEAT repeat protein